jgi:ATP-dependent DNA ligase
MPAGGRTGRQITGQRPAMMLSYDWTERLSAIAAAAELIKAKSFTIDGEAVVLGPDGLSRFEELSRRKAAYRDPPRLRLD